MSLAVEVADDDAYWGQRLGETEFFWIMAEENEEMTWNEGHLE